MVVTTWPAASSGVERGDLLAGVADFAGGDADALEDRDVRLDVER
jgi:hypothetical protein